jgi:hypothetical protein
VTRVARQRAPIAIGSDDCELLNEAREYLAASNIADVSRMTGVSFWYLHRVMRGKIANPGVRVIDKVLAYKRATLAALPSQVTRARRRPPKES